MLQVAKSILAEADGQNEVGGAIILNSTAEFCRTLGDIPTYGQAGNRGEEEQELLVSFSFFSHQVLLNCPHDCLTSLRMFFDNELFLRFLFT